MKKYDQLTGIQKRYVRELKVYFIGSIVTVLLGIVVLILSFTVLKGNGDVFATSLQLIFAGFVIGAWSVYVRCNDKVLKIKATRFFDERLINRRLKTIDLAQNIFVVTLLLAVLVFIYIEPIVSVLFMCVLMFVGVAYIISYLIVNRGDRVDKE